MASHVYCSPSLWPERGAIHSHDAGSHMRSPSDTNGSPQASSPRPTTLSDPWARRPVPLNGPLERSSIHPSTLGFVTGLLGLAAAFILFQFFVTPVVLVAQIVVAEGGIESLHRLADTAVLIDAYTRELIVSNSVGQAIGLAVPALLMARLHTRRLFAYLRIRPVDAQLLGLTVVGLLGMQPVVQWLAQVNQALPLPEQLRLLEESQLQMIQKVLESDLGVAFNVAMLALVPGVCEELLFRGYAQRQFERAAGPVSGILLSGILFGVYHLRFSQVLPLVVLGVFLAYLTWRTGALWPAILGHILHNGLAVVMAHLAQQRPGLDVQRPESLPLPWYAVVGGFVIVGGVLYLLNHRVRRLQDS